MPPAIDTARLTQSLCLSATKMTLLMASAPWVENQFDLKGVDTLLEAAVAAPQTEAYPALARPLAEGAPRSALSATA